ncbi:substrate-binding domain-containing protein [Actinokineospora sp. PR83]|uniref:substrate-binding domain-containing protein n=1 Tax=Actinokineospora sp. PR83 TaxID=2884908 RepID=UPI001F3B64D5|nr:substrate-binding domain-containing protein [Actinokineospora sp. PR83]MCG8919431.1 substrate-binding domain-containing protein [Actinokineospora sp. PR83]
MTDNLAGADEPTQSMPSPPPPTHRTPPAASAPAPRLTTEEHAEQVQLFGAELLRLRTEQTPRLTLEQLSKRASYSPAQLSRAAKGDRLPTWPLAEAYIRGCAQDQDPAELDAELLRWRARWDSLAMNPVGPISAQDPVGPISVRDPVGPIIAGEAGSPTTDPVNPGISAQDQGGARRRRPWRPWVMGVAGVAVLALIAGLITALAQGGTDPDGNDPSEGGAVPLGKGIPWSSAFAGCGTTPVTVTLRVVSSPDKSTLLTEAAATYGPRLVGNRCVKVDITPFASGLMADRLAGPTWLPEWGKPEWGKDTPDVWSPAARTWLSAARERAAAEQVSTRLPATDDQLSVVTTPLVIAVPRSVVTAMGWEGTPLGWDKIEKLSRDPRGWAGEGDHGLGPFRMGKTSPTRSTSGLNATIAQARTIAGRDLTPAILGEQDLRNRMETTEKAIEHYGDTTLTSLAALREATQPADPKATKQKASDYLSAIAVEEATMIAYNQGYPCGAASTEDRCAKLDDPIKDPLVAFYPPEGTLYSNHPWIPLSPAPGTDPAEADAKAKVATDFLGYLRSPDGVTAFAESGFRVMNSDGTASPTTTITHANGADPTVTLAPPFTLPDGKTIQAVFDTWQQVRKPANVLIVIDTSGSMGPQPGETGPSKLALVQEAAKVITGDDPVTGRPTFTTRDHVGMWDFSTKIPGGIDGQDYKTDVPIGPMDTDHRNQITKAFTDLTPHDGTGLYDTVRAAAAHMRTSDPDPAKNVYKPGYINAIVFLTDGKNEDKNTQNTITSVANDLSSTTPLIKVFPIAYGNDTGFTTDGDKTSDLDKIAAATHTTVSDATTPTTIGTVFADVLSNF